MTAAIPLSELAEMAADRFGDLVKAVVDIERGVMALDAEMHADEGSRCSTAGPGRKTCGA